MNENQPPETFQNKRGNFRKKLAIISLLVLIIIGLVAGVYLWQQGKLRSQDSYSRARLASLQGEITSLKQEISEASNEAEPVSFSEKMPNGKTISYPLTEQNSKIVWWYGGRGDEPNEPNGTYIYLTTTDVIRFMSEIDFDYLRTACVGDNAGLLGLNDMNYWAITTNTKALSHGGAARCIDLLASEENGKYKNRALEISTQEKQDIDTFVKSINIK